MPAPPCRILLADDHEDSAVTLATLFELWGHTVDIARDGAEAVRLAAKCHPQLVFLDIGMPLLDGYEVAKQIRRQPHGKEMVLIALSGWGSDEDRARGVEAGFDHHLLKPVDPATLQEFINHL